MSDEETLGSRADIRAFHRGASIDWWQPQLDKAKACLAKFPDWKPGPLKVAGLERVIAGLEAKTDDV